MNKFALLLFSALFMYNLQAQDYSQTTFVTEKQSNSKNNFSQKLSINWVSENIITYSFVFQNGKCSQNIKGKAMINTKNIKSIERSNEGDSIIMNEYVDSNRKEFDVKLAINTSNKKAIINFQTKNDYDMPSNCSLTKYHLVSK